MENLKTIKETNIDLYNELLTYNCVVSYNGKILYEGLYNTEYDYGNINKSCVVLKFDIPNEDKQFICLEEHNETIEALKNLIPAFSELKNDHKKYNSAVNLSFNLPLYNICEEANVLKQGDSIVKIYENLSIIESMSDDDEIYIKTYGKKLEIPKIYFPKNENELVELLCSIKNPKDVDEINEFWMKYNKNIFNNLGPWKLFDDGADVLSGNTLCFGDHYGLSIRGKFSLLHIENYKTNKGILASIDYNYKKSFFYNLIELIKQNKYLYNYFVNKDHNDYMFNDKLSNDKIRDLPKGKECHIDEDKLFID